ncbi:MAG: hypothetical protein AB7O86_05740 [Porticoccaceae bacterium]
MGTVKSGFDSLDTALRMREIIRAAVIEEVRKYAPTDTLATVSSWDDTNHIVNVKYAGETTPVPVSYGLFRPSFSGQIVRVSGPASDRYIVDVLPVLYTGYQPGDVRWDYKFATTTHRLAAFPTVPPAGTRCYVTDIMTEFLSDGTGWVRLNEPWQSATPTWTNVTHGTTGAVNTLTYKRTNGLMHVTYRLVLGSGGDVTGQPTVTLPVACGVSARGTLAVEHVSTGFSRTEGTCDGTAAGATSLTPLVGSTGGSYLASSNVSSTVPHNYVSSDVMVISGWLPMNTPYL